MNIPNKSVTKKIQNLDWNPTANSPSYHHLSIEVEGSFNTRNWIVAVLLLYTAPRIILLAYSFQVWECASNKEPRQKPQSSGR